MDLKVVPLHHHPQYKKACCELINSEWKRSDTARMHSLNNSCDTLPTSLVLVNHDEKVIGHSRLSKLPSISEACFVESVVMDKNERNKGYGKILMLKTEEYCRDVLKLVTVYLATKGQEGFYKKLGYYVCKPVSIYGSCVIKKENNDKQTVTCEKISDNNIVKLCENMSLKSDIKIKAPPLPPPPPLPLSKANVTNVVTKTFMRKELK